ncbi:hypothetical protein PFLUV_G00244750 [Perca fluviatilis]|uniref:Ubiquitin-like protease family profile domain-containing protein n=1 Tax=Perca fluviatilis TaxID=8168 RepID=A0A6A5EJ71_PERFL|nr:uncharacterized protein LOC120551748 [Perca fluviatilis]KAF1374002.1 hypothetical protein PFLUV_G00244750 [Perca fluviatilis]
MYRMLGQEGMPRDYFIGTLRGLVPTWSWKVSQSMHIWRHWCVTIIVKTQLFIDSFAMTTIWNRGTPRLKMKPQEYNLVVGIINDHHHWTLAVIYPGSKKSLFFDPLGESKKDLQRCLETTRAFMRKKGCNVSRWRCETVQHPKESDFTSCGVFALKFAELLLKKQEVDFPANQQDVNQYRLQIAITLLLESDDLTRRVTFVGRWSMRRTVIGFNVTFAAVGSTSCALKVHQQRDHSFVPRV